MRGFFLVAREREGHRQCTDTPAIHVDNEDKLGHPIPVGALTGGETAGGKSRGGLEKGGQQLHVRLHHGKQKAGYGNESQ